MNRLLITLTLFIAFGSAASAQVFVRGDVDNNLIVDAADITMLTDSLFSFGSLACTFAADANDDGTVSIADVTFLIAFVSTGGSPPPAPFPACGPDPTAPVPGVDCCVAGDANGSGGVNVADVTFLITRIFAGGAPPPCCVRASANGDALVNIADITFLIALIFIGGSFPVCGPTGMTC